MVLKRKNQARNLIIYSSIVLLMLSLAVGSIFFVNRQTGLSNIQIIGRPVFGTLSCSPDENPVRLSRSGRRA